MQQRHAGLLDSRAALQRRGRARVKSGAWCMNMNQLVGARAGRSLVSNEQEIESRGYKVGHQAAVQQRAAPCHLHS